MDVSGMLPLVTARAYLKIIVRVGPIDARSTQLRHDSYVIYCRSCGLTGQKQLTVKGRTSKRTFSRDMPLNDRELNVLRRWQMQTGHEAGLVFHPRGKQVTNLKKGFCKLLEDAVIDRADKRQGAVV